MTPRKAKKKHHHPEYGKMRAHTKIRAWQRYRVTLTGPEMWRMINQIKRGDSVYVGMHTHTRTFHLVWVQCTWLPIVYNKKKQNPHTCREWEVLPEWIMRFRDDPKRAGNIDKVEAIFKECINGRYIDLRPPFQWELEGVGIRCLQG